MSRRAARFTQADVCRAIKAVEQAGAHMTVEILPDGTIRIAEHDEKRSKFNQIYDEIDNKPRFVL
jgi:hypothetical protein